MAVNPIISLPTVIAGNVNTEPAAALFPSDQSFVGSAVVLGREVSRSNGELFILRWGMQGACGD